MNRPPLQLNKRRSERLAQAVVEHVMRRLPADVAEAAKECAVELSWADECESESAADADMLGWFEGASMADTDADPAVGPPRIILLLDRLWEYSERRTETFEEEVAVTLLHELGHFLGWDEDEVEARGL